MVDRPDPVANAPYLAEVKQNMPHVPPPPPDAVQLWSRIEIDLYFGSGGSLRPSAATLAKRMRTIKPDNTKAPSESSPPPLPFSPLPEDVATARQRAAERNYGTKWLAMPLGQSNATAAVRLFIFGHVGSAPAFWFPLMKRFEGSKLVEAIAVQPPGRGHRMREPPFRRVAELARAFVEDVPWLLNEKPYIFLGHSFGCAQMYYAAVEAQKRALRLPSHMIFSSRPSIDFTYAAPYYLSPEADVVDFMREITPQELLSNKEMMDLMLPIIRADYEANETCTLPLAQAPVLPVPFTLCTGGPADKTPNDPPMNSTILGWRKVTSAGEAPHHDHAGGHYWLKDDPGFSWLVNQITQIAAAV
eukprot:GGOE01043931.1.p1 GENE.GGOE01043931.1~~GGOE01043931.1.p1  ORF type:complete len:368 (-),score=100.73 GGOE01043931.1:22-1098(-)